MKTSAKLMGAFALAAALAFNCHGVILNYGGVFKFAGANKAFADACANEVLDRMGPRTWLITDDLLDKALRKAAVARGQELNIICIKLRSEAECKAYCNRLADLVAEKKLTAGGKSNADLVFTLRELGLLPFLKVWFKNDPNIMNEVMTIGWPDIWFWANCRPVPDGLGFRGVKDVSSVDGLKIKSDFEALWKKLEPSIVIPQYSGKGSYSIREVEALTNRRRMELRRHFGLIANNIGVLLQDLHHDKEAFEMYELVLGTIDCDNICALFNEFEMIRVGNQVAMGRKREVEQQLEAIIGDPKRRYRIGSLSSYYGYIRSPEFLVRHGLSWARSGETRYAIENLKDASDLVPGGKPSTELLNLMAGFYAQGRQVEKSREKYQEVLKADATNYDALMGLWRLSLQEGAIEEAKQYLKRASDAGDAKPMEGRVRFDVPLRYMMDNNLDEAYEALKKITYLQPSIQAWALLAGVVLQLADSATDPKQKQKILAEVENVILPKMEGLANSPRDFYVHMTRALTLMRKGTDPETMKQARSSLEIAWKTRPVVSVGGMVLDLDYRLLDREGAERHALQILRMDEKHVFANWVMGSIRMGEDRLPEAERYLRASAQAAHPLPAAQNDLAELFRRRGNLVEAEEIARAATKSAPDLYVAWETLASTLLDRGKDLDEAEQCILKAIDLAGGKDDLRMQLTLARVQLAKRDFAKARNTLRMLDKRRDELEERDRAVLDELRKKAWGK